MPSCQQVICHGCNFPVLSTGDLSQGRVLPDLAQAPRERHSQRQASCQQVICHGCHFPSCQQVICQSCNFPSSPQVICHRDVCFPTWLKHPVNITRGDSRLLDPFPLMQEAFTVHVTMPKPHPSLASPETVKTGSDMFAEIGRRILEKSGRKHLLG